MPLPASSSCGRQAPTLDVFDAISELRDLVDLLREGSGALLPAKAKAHIALALRLLGSAPPYEPDCEHTQVEIIWSHEEDAEEPSPVEGVCLSCLSVLHGHRDPHGDPNLCVWNGPVSQRAEDHPYAGPLAGVLSCHACDRDAVRVTREGPACPRHE